MWVARVGGGGDGELPLNGHKLAVWTDGEVPEMDGGRWLHNDVNVLNVTDLCTYKKLRG